jgi:hypothetical protein
MIYPLPLGYRALLELPDSEKMHDPRIEVIDPVVPLRRWKQIHAGVLCPGFQRAFGSGAAIELEGGFPAGSRALQTLKAMR